MQWNTIGTYTNRISIDGRVSLVLKMGLQLLILSASAPIILPISDLKDLLTSPAIPGITPFRALFISDRDRASLTSKASLTTGYGGVEQNTSVSKMKEEGSTQETGKEMMGGFQGVINVERRTKAARTSDFIMRCIRQQRVCPVFKMENRTIFSMF